MLELYRVVLYCTVSRIVFQITIQSIGVELYDDDDEGDDVDVERTIAYNNNIKCAKLLE